MTTCDACGIDLTPTPEQIKALRRFGNPLRRPPCLETVDGLHIVRDVGLWRGHDLDSSVRLDDYGPKGGSDAGS